ncbi:MAG TPA: cyclic pyranopterin monophosphate synthase MoaC [Rubricoccaceae bacterium]|jgi:cyclic pyranopterin phosphate synthase
MLTHIDGSGRPAMVDVGDKAPTRRTARARALVVLPPAVAALFDGDEIRGPKGPVFHTAVLTGTQAAKKASDLILLCHPLALDRCRFDISLGAPAVDGRSTVTIECEVSTIGRTGVEMEALAGVYGAALAVYDMCKGVSHDLVISETRLVSKTGGSRDVSE